MSNIPASRNSYRGGLVPVREIIEARIRRDPEFTAGLIQEAIERLIDNDPVTAQLLLRDVVNGTVGFGSLARATDIPEKSLMRMLSTKGNPQARNLFRIIHELQAHTHVRMEVRARPVKKSTARAKGL